MANIFQKIGSAFGQYGMDNRMPADQFLNLPKGDRRQMQVEGLRKFSEAMNLIGAQQSGDPQRMAMAQNQIRQRQVDRQNQELGDSAYEAVIQAGGTKEQAELARKNPNLASQIVAGSFKPDPKKTKSDYVVEILEKIKNNPDYKLTDTDQRILDTISDTDPMEIMIRNRIKEMQTSKFNNENTSQTGVVTVTTQQQYDALPSGSLFIENGKTYRKP